MSPRKFLASAISLALLLVFVPFAARAIPLGTATTVSEETGAPGKETATENKSEAEPSGPQAAPRRKATAPSYMAEDWTVAIYPIFFWAPVMGGSVNMPNVPGTPGTPGQPTKGDVDGGLSSAYSLGFAIQKSRFVADFSLLWANFDSEGKGVPITLDTDLVFYDATAGFKVSRDLAVIGGIRHLSLGFDAKLGTRPTETWEPSVTDPMFGMQWRPSLSQHLGLDVEFKVGGFGAGTDLDLSTSGRLDWRFARHWGLMAGYGVLYFRVNKDFSTSAGSYTREISQTLHGPIFGLGIYF